MSRRDFRPISIDFALKNRKKTGPLNGSVAIFIARVIGRPRTSLAGPVKKKEKETRFFIRAACRP